MFIYIYVYIYMFIYIYICLYIYYMFIYIYVNTHARARTHTHAHTRTHTQAAKNAATRGVADAEVDAAITSIEELWDRDGWVLDLLLDMGKELRSVPMIEPELQTVVLVGSPNVGKSSIVNAISTGAHSQKYSQLTVVTFS